MEPQFVENLNAEPQLFAEMDREEMLAAFAEMLKSTPAGQLRVAAEQIKLAFYKAQSENTSKLRAKFVADGGREEDFTAAYDGLDAHLRELLGKYRTLRSEHTKKVAAERDNNLKKKQDLLSKLKAMADGGEDINANFAEFKNLQQEWQNTGAAPQEHNAELWRQYNHCVEKFYDMAKVNKELRELDFKKNYELKQLLCEKAEILLLSKDVAAAFRELQKYHEQWREVGPVSLEHRKSVWERFSEVSAIINKRNAEHYAKQKLEKDNNLAMKRSLCAEVEALVASPPRNVCKWGEAADNVVEIQRKWRAVGAVPSKDNDAVYQQFKLACNAFFEARKVFQRNAKEAFENSVKQKTALCERAQALAQSEEWEQTAKELVAMQNEWKNIGALPAKLSEELWNKFRAACNAFFERRKEHNATRENPEVANMRAKEALIEEMKAYEGGASPEENMAMAAKFQQRWVEIGASPKNDAERVRKAYREALQELYKRLNINDEQRRAHDFKHQMEQDKDPQHLRAEQSKIMRTIRYLEDEKRRLETNISFFGKSKNAEQYISEFRSQIEKQAKDIALLKERLQILKNLMPQPQPKK